MKILIAPDKFKGTLTALEAAEAMAHGVRDVLPDADIRTQPIADGGEGTLEAVLAAGGIRQETTVRGPLDSMITAPWALLGSTAVIETARASGLEHITPSAASAGAAHSYGSGELIRAALDAGATDIVLGVGGSAMTDGGSGALYALGARAYDDDDAELGLGGLVLSRAARVDVAGLDPRLAGVTLRIAVDVQNPLHGPEGAAHVFGEQKGAGAALRTELDAALKNWARVLLDAAGVQVQQPGAGAAGGFPAAFLAFADAALEPGFALVADLTGLESELADADLVITGEGSLDAQSEFGKAPLGLADVAHQRGIPVIAVAGRISLTAERLGAHGVVASCALGEVAPSLEECLANAGLYARRAVERALRAHLGDH
ncbi:glycerate kinase [Arthrobacter sp. H5]|uniref:glycerate kinase n=1 Tax=Arthrobacter sp. H5 TaxID=1267973 RepID=UPI0004BC70CF|nr:glycerate kinase [Arthrobacter sp. H5]